MTVSREPKPAPASAVEVVPEYLRQLREMGDDEAADALVDALAGVVVEED